MTDGQVAEELPSSHGKLFNAMTRPLDYATPAVSRSTWTERCRAAARFCVPGLVAAAAACLLSSTLLHVFRHIEGRPTLFGPPHGRLYEAGIVLLPFLMVTALLPIAWGRAIVRSLRGDRLAIAVLTLVPLAAIWFGAVMWLFQNADRAFP